MTLHRRAVLLGGLGAIAAPYVLRAQGALERKDLKLGVGGKALLYYLPLTIAERRGFFKEQGLNVEINDFGGGSQSLQALVGGSVDVVTWLENPVLLQCCVTQGPGDMRALSRSAPVGGSLSQKIFWTKVS